MLIICCDVTVTMMMSGGVHYDLVRDDSRLTHDLLLLILTGSQTRKVCLKILFNSTDDES